MDHALGEIYSGVFTVRPASASSLLLIMFHSRLTRADANSNSYRTQTRFGPSSTPPESTSTSGSGGCRSTTPTARRSTRPTPISATYVPFPPLPLPALGKILTDGRRVLQTGGKRAGCCTAALFLKAFVDGIEEKDGKPAPLRWAHIDIAGTMDVTRPSPYQFKGMTGRPTR